MPVRGKFYIHIVKRFPNITIDEVLNTGHLFPSVYRTSSSKTYIQLEPIRT